MYSIAGILRPKRGSIRLSGEEIAGLTSAGIVARGLALVPENRLVFPQMSVEENLRAGAYQRRDAAGVAEDIGRMFGRFPRLQGGASSSPARCRAVSSRCWRWRARSCRGRASC